MNIFKSNGQKLIEEGYVYLNLKLKEKTDIPKSFEKWHEQFQTYIRHESVKSVTNHDLLRFNGRWFGSVSIRKSASEEELREKERREINNFQNYLGEAIELLTRVKNERPFWTR